MRSIRIRDLILVTSVASAAALAAAPASAQQPYDGLWNVTVVTKTGSCEPSQSSTVTVAEGKISAQGAGRKFDRDVRRRAHHARASVGVGLAVQQCLEQQNEFFGKHGRSPRRLIPVGRGARAKIRSTKRESRAMTMLRREFHLLQSVRLPAAPARCAAGRDHAARVGRACEEWLVIA